MIIRMSNTVFLSLTFIVGVIIGGVKTPEIIAYAKAMQNVEEVDRQETQKKAKPLPKRLRKSKRIV